MSAHNDSSQTEDVGEVHVYDGIVEHDNRLPRWWLATLWGAVVFSFGYWFVYETFGVADHPQESFDKAMAVRREAEDKARVARAAIVDDAFLVALSQDPGARERGKAVYDSTCLACHADKGQGLVGPNLTDSAWLHGGAPTQILATVNDGVVAKGMPAWGPALGAGKVNDVVAYLLTMKGTNVPGKEPQGEIAADASAHAARN